MGAELLRIDQVRKSFDGIFALKGVSFTVDEGECLALVGENGAGKSTLMKILSGVWPAGSYEGEASFRGQPLRLKNPLEGRRAGISIIHQELCLFPKLTAAENLFLTEEFPYDGEPSLRLWRRVKWEPLFARAEAVFRELGFDVPARAPVEELSVAQRQLIEIARAFHHRAKLLILDEPTSALSRNEVHHLFEVIKRMRASGMSFIYISHKLDEVFALADRIVVLRDGQSVQELDPKATNDAEIIRHMVGRPLKETKKQVWTEVREPLFEVKDLSHRSPAGKDILNGINLKIGRGEVLGVSGLMGSGRTELLRSIVGMLPGARSGECYFRGEKVEWQNIDEAMDSGVAFVPEDRKKDGLFLDLGSSFNLTISVLPKLMRKFRGLDLKREQDLVADLIKRLGVKCPRPNQPVRVLSGGNQQKVLLAKMVAREPVLLLLDEPTRGIDVGAKEEIYEIIQRLAGQGISVLLVSSELPEILMLSDRVLVLKEGRAVGELVNDNLTQEKIMAYAAGGVSAN